MAVVDGPVRLVEETRPVEQVSELATRETVRSPIDLGHAAAPGHPLEDRPVSLGKLAIEAGVVRDRDHAPSTKAATAASSSLWPATISSVMPVIASLRPGSDRRAR